MKLDTSPCVLDISEEVGTAVRELQLFHLDGAIIAFSEQAQSLFEVAPTTKLLIDEVKKKTPMRQVLEILIANNLADSDKARGIVSETLEALRIATAKNEAHRTVPEPGLQAPPDAIKPKLLAFDPIATKVYKLLETRVAVQFAIARQIVLIDSILGHLTDEDQTSYCNSTIQLPATRRGDGRIATHVIRDRAYISYASRLSLLGPMVKAAIWQSAVNNYNFLFYIHAGVVASRERCLLLPAPAGSGKSSLTIALTANGFDYFSDEIALIEKETFQVPAVRLAMCVKSTGWDVVAPYYPGIVDFPVHIRSDAKAIRYLPPPSKPNPATAIVSHIVFPHYQPNADTSLIQLKRSDALARLMGECLALNSSLTRETCDSILRWISSINCYSLEYSSLQESIPIIKAMFALS